VPLALSAFNSLITTTTSATADYAFVGFGAAGLRQTDTNNIDGYVINFIALRNFDAKHWTSIQINSQPTTICFRGSDASGNCTTHTVAAGTLKMAFALNKWAFDPTCVYYRVQFTIQPTGFAAGATVQHLTTSDPNIELVSFTDTDGFQFNVSISKLYNKGNNTFGIAESSVSTTTGAVVNIDIPIAALSNSGWFAYDPEVSFAPATQSQSTGTSAGTGSSTAQGTSTGTGTSSQTGSGAGSSSTGLNGDAAHISPIAALVVSAFTALFAVLA